MDRSGSDVTDQPRAHAPLVLTRRARFSMLWTGEPTLTDHTTSGRRYTGGNDTTPFSELGSSRGAYDRCFT